MKIVSIRSNDFPEFNFYTSENCDTIVGLVSNKHIVAKGYNSSPNDEYFIALVVQIDNREIAGSKAIYAFVAQDTCNLHDDGMGWPHAKRIIGCYSGKGSSRL